MKALKNLGLIGLSILVLIVAVGGLFGLKSLLNRRDTELSTPEPVEVQTKTGTEEPTEEPAISEEVTETPTETATESPEARQLQQQVERVLADLTLEEKIGQMFLVDTAQLGSNSATSVNQRMQSRLRNYPVGGVLFGTRNITSREQVSLFMESLQECVDEGLFFAVVEESGAQGTVFSSGIEMPETEAAAAYGQTRDVEGAKAAASEIAVSLKKLGFNLNLGLMAEVLPETGNDLFSNRSFGADAQLVSQMMEAQVWAVQTQQVAAAVKYFPGSAFAVQNKKGYLESSRTPEQMAACEWLPYETAIRSGVDCILLSNMTAPNLTGNDEPCSLSSQVVNDLLRGQLGYQGVVVSAPLNESAITRHYSSSEAVLRAVQAGVDMLLLPGNLEGTYSALESAVKNGTVPMERIDQSLRRILAVKIVRGIIDPEEYDPLPTPKPERSWEEDEEEWDGDSEDEGSDSDESGENEDDEEDDSSREEDEE